MARGVRPPQRGRDDGAGEPAGAAADELLTRPTTSSLTAHRRRSEPSHDHHAVVPFTVSGTGEGVAQRVVVPGSEHVFETDAYPAFGGADASPSPLSYALGALTSCNQVVAQVVAKDLGIALGRFTIEATGDLDTAVLVGGREGNANFTRVTVTATVEADATPEQFERLRSETERRCPVSQLFIRSGVDFTSTWTQVQISVTAGA